MLRFGALPTIYRSMADDTAGGGQQNQQQQQSGEQNQQQQENKNIVDPSIAEINELWQAPKDTSGGNQQQQQQQPVVAPTNTEIAEQFQNHIAGLKLTEGFNVDKIKEGLAQNDLTALNESMGNMAGKIYQAAILDGNKLMETKIAAAVEKAVEQSTGRVTADFAVQKLHEALPFTKNPSTAPIAVAVMKQFMSKGVTQDDAIPKVKEFFKNVFNSGAKDLGMTVAPKNKPGGNGFQGSFSETEVTAGGSDEIDFEGLFAPRS